MKAKTSSNFRCKHFFKEMIVPDLTIGALSAQTDCSVPTIRYYEQIGLLPRPRRAANGHRHYHEADLQRLGFIKRCRDFGFAIEQVRELVGLFEEGNRSCVDVRDMAQAHLDIVREKLEQMHELEAKLTTLVADCNVACLGGAARDCVIIEEISSAPASSTGCCAAPRTSAVKGKMRATELKRC